MERGPSLEKIIKDGPKARVTLSLGDVVTLALFMAKSGQIEDANNFILRLLCATQKIMDFESISYVLLRKKRVDLLFNFIESEHISTKTFHSMIIASFRESLRQD